MHQTSRETYGYPRVHAELRSQAVHCSRKRVARLMRQAGLVTCMQRLWERSRRGRTTSHGHQADNRLARQFWSEQPNQRWVSDITMIPTAEGFLHVAAIMDLNLPRFSGVLVKVLYDTEKLGDN
ncbi:MAG: IS3 family transposase [Gammaproteobacteria bacterium]|nr:IS3 family transposase [Gammaproteobacteria bacterium]